MAKRGKLIVIDGIDKVGKETQTKLLVKRLTREGIRACAIHFPRYKQNLLGHLIKECLMGKRGNFLSLDANVASVLYAADRFESKPVIEEMLAKGVHVVSDRYASSNQIHQGGKIRNRTKRAEFIAWLNKLEYKVFKIPRPTLTIHLSMPLRLSRRLMKKAYGHYRTARADTAELNLHYYQQSEKAALELAEREGWEVVSCALGGEVRSIQDIHEEVYALVKSVLPR